VGSVIVLVRMFVLVSPLFSERNLFLFMVEAIAWDLMNQRERW